MGQTESRDALLARRLDLVASVCALTAEAQRLNQKLAGVEMDVLRLELEIGRRGTNAQLVQDLHEAEESAAAFRNACTACEERIAAAEGDIDDVDRRLAKTVN
ncbi:hypothetical protein LB523_00970 [Mesorhizobium sp. ESP-6-4]|uniref:hypothetical protein n=1 Tax=unclassified Mesorhizobium TaxID=325217 RepID=UPI0011296D37|nr:MULTISPECIES: hypothetical protein [unclassified Mesorhizobium]MBZ9657599.1 hypothetical protein [Mesorhizobium sp. ESP-6-4]MBZ9733554.1 hypothetical protein [Mesorhizobium sp. CA9]MBZ9765339.1 hypothetical protein [Mesorhizobium sp. CA6]MBZ9814597.1 hypothetical protein [Mesorhizobium sp. CA7]MBZ9831295.1 hypothetical protein [Mesorhizobium sp. CA2]